MFQGSLKLFATIRMGVSTEPRAGAAMSLQHFDQVSGHWGARHEPWRLAADSLEPSGVYAPRTPRTPRKSLRIANNPWRLV